MKIKVVIYCLLAAAVVLCGVTARAVSVNTMPTLNCESVSKKLLRGIDSVDVPGWNFGKIECMTGREPYVDILYKGPEQKKAVFSVKLRSQSPELMMTTKYYTLGYKSDKRKEQTSEEVEILSAGIAGVIGSNESREIVDEFIQSCSKNAGGQKNTINIRVTGQEDYLFHRYNEQIAALLTLAQSHKNADLWSTVYISRYFVLCPVVFGAIIILMILYIKISLILYRINKSGKSQNDT